MKTVLEGQDIEEISKAVSQKILASLKPYLKGRVEDDKLFTVKTLAEYLGVSKQWVYERVSLKEIPYIKMGKFPRFKKTSIDCWLNGLSMPAMNTTSSPLKRIK